MEQPLGSPDQQAAKPPEPKSPTEPADAQPPKKVAHSAPAKAARPKRSHHKKKPPAKKRQTVRADVGPPPPEPSRLKQCVISFRMDHPEYRALWLWAGRNGRNLSEYARSATLAQMEKDGVPVEEADPAA